MPAHALLDTRSDALAALKPFGVWINRYARRHGDSAFAARLVEAPFGRTLMLAVEMCGPDGPVATYKCNLTAIGEHQNAALLFSPLVVVWHAECGARNPEQGRMMIDHLVCAVRSFRRTAGAAGQVLIATGNLTEAKGGRPFFESLGWDIVAPETRASGRRGAGLATPLEVVMAQIEAAVAPLRAAGTIAAEPVAIAVLRVA